MTQTSKSPAQIKFEQDFLDIQNKHYMDADITSRWTPEYPKDMISWYRQRYMESQREIRKLKSQIRERDIFLEELPFQLQQWLEKRDQALK